MASSRVGAQASNVIPTMATASIDMRLVKGVDHRKAVERVIEHIRKQGCCITDVDPSPEVRMAHPKVVKSPARGGGYNAVRPSMGLPISQEVINAAESARGNVVKLPAMGG